MIRFVWKVHKIEAVAFGACLSHVGNNANSVKGNAKAKANPNIPTAGAMMLPDVETSTSRKPIMGPVHEKDTSVSVNAIRKILSSPPAFEARLSTEFSTKTVM